MECIIFIGIQGSGKSTFYKQSFFDTHVRINLDMLKTRHKEDIFLSAAIKAKQNFVVDNTNPTAAVRKKYIDYAKAYGFKVIGYYFVPDLIGALQRNEGRSGKARVPAIAVRSTLNKLEAPQFAEGFQQLYSVKIVDGGQFAVTDMSQ